MVLLPRFFVVWYAAYLVQNWPKTLHSSEAFSRPWIIQCFDAPLKRSIYRLLHLRALSSFAKLVFDKVDSPLLFLLIPVRLASAQVVFNKKVLPNLHIYLQKFPYTQTYLHIFKGIVSQSKPCTYAFFK